jgi:adenylate cyclase class IV
MENIEFKAELRDAALARSIALASGALHALSVEQTDTYYRVADARLKRRETRPAPVAGGEGPGGGGGGAGGGSGAGLDREAADVEFILYERADGPGPRPSRFTIYTPGQARERFGAGLPAPWVVVRKRREVLLLDGVRIHLDRVEGLGQFIEFEAPVTPDRDARAAGAAVERLRNLLRPALGEPVSGSYSDLLAPPATG